MGAEAAEVGMAVAVTGAVAVAIAGVAMLGGSSVVAAELMVGMEGTGDTLEGREEAESEVGVGEARRALS